MTNLFMLATMVTSAGPAIPPMPEYSMPMVLALLFAVYALGVLTNARRQP
jgi:hypothetical protein